MKSKKVRSWLCAKCKSKIDENAYYCRKCDSIVRNDVVPGSRIPDRTLSTRLRHIWEIHPFQKIMWLALLVAITISGGKELNKYLQTKSDNRSSAVFQLEIDSPRTPFTCRLRICHIVIHVKNKTDMPQQLVGIPFFTMSDGKSFGPADPKAVAYPAYFGQYYCQRSFNLSIPAHKTAEYMGICALDLPIGQALKEVSIKDKDVKSVVTVRISAVVPPS